MCTFYLRENNQSKMINSKFFKIQVGQYVSYLFSLQVSNDMTFFFCLLLKLADFNETNFRQMLKSYI